MSDWREKNERVEELLPQARKNAKTARVPCPFCADEGHTDRKLSLVVIILTGKWKCYRCQEWGRLRGEDYVDYDDDPFAEEEDPEVFDKPEEFVPLTGDRSYTFKPARQYLRSRGVPERVWEECELHACDEGFWAGRIIVPFFDPRDERKWLGWIARLWVPKPSPSAYGAWAMPYLYPADMSKGTYFWNHNSIKKKTKTPVLIVEGSFDSFPHWPHVAACLGKPSQLQVEALYEARRPVCICLDGDAWEEAHMLSCKLQFDNRRAGCLRLPAGVDPAELSSESLQRAAVKSIGRFEPVRV